VHQDGSVPALKNQFKSASRPITC